MKRWKMAGLLVTTAIAIAVSRPAAPSPAANVYYVSPNGSAEGDGSREKPFPSAAVALAKVGGGATLVFRPGIYRGPIHVPRRFQGTKDRPTTLKAEEKWQAIVIGAEYHAITNDDGCVWVVVDGFEVMGARYDGIKMNGNFNTVRNCYVHNNAHMGVAMHGQTGGVIENNLIEFNGSHVQFHHGIYADGDRLTFRGNIVRHNAGFGLHLYTKLTNSVVVNNLVHGHARKSGIIVACPEGGGRNVIANNTIANNATGLVIWNGDGETVVNNIIAGPGALLSYDESTKNVRVDYNLTERTLEPAAAHRLGPSNITGDPRFVDADRGVYWLRPDSPAIGKGAPQHAPERDFWGRPLRKGQPVDLGCFVFVPSLAAPEMRSQWHHQWAYRFAPSGRQDVPDLWAPPR
jgi:parallel beta-helix repeat protein